MCLGGLESILGPLKLVYASEALDYVLMNSVNASEVLYQEEFLSKEISFSEVACDSKVPEGSGIDTFLLGGMLSRVIGVLSGGC